MTAASDTTVRTERRTAARLAKLRAVAFRTARRHTLFVKSLRWLLPVVVVTMMVGYSWLLLRQVGLKVGGGRLNAAEIQITTDDLKMKGVTYAGVTKDGGRYDVRARDAQVDITQKGPVTLNAIDGDLKQPSGIVTKVTSVRGILDNAKGEMDLFDGVTIDASNGLKARMKSAKVYNKENRVIAREGVVADTATGRIAAQAMELETKQRRGVFTGNVMVRMTPDQTSTKSSPIGGGKDAKLPLDMTAQKLEFDDSAKLAVFTGGVTAVQGDSQLTANALRVTYEGRTNVPGMPQPTAPASPTEAGQTKLSKLQATGQITITQGVDRRITAEAMDVDVAADTALFTGPSVEVLQGKNRLLGRRLDVDRKAGRSRLSSPAEGRTPAGRIKTTFVQEQKAGAPQKAIKAAVPGEQSSGLMQFKTDPNAPMDIEAETLDVNDATKQAIFRNAVRAQQGDFIINANTITAHYTGDTGLMGTGDAATAPKGQGAQVSRVEAVDNVVITSKDGQEARGRRADFDTKSNIVVLSGGVQVKQERTIITGARLRIDLNTGVANFENEDPLKSVGSASPVQLPPKSAPGPGGLPPVETTPAVLPKAPTPGVRQNLTIYPEDFKKQKDGNGRIVPKAAPKPAVDGWQPSTSPSPVYREQKSQ